MEKISKEKYRNALIEEFLKEEGGLEVLERLIRENSKLNEKILELEKKRSARELLREIRDWTRFLLVLLSFLFFL